MALRFEYTKKKLRAFGSSFWGWLTAHITPNIATLSVIGGMFVSGGGFALSQYMKVDKLNDQVQEDRMRIASLETEAKSKDALLTKIAGDTGWLVKENQHLSNSLDELTKFLLERNK